MMKDKVEDDKSGSEPVFLVSWVELLLRNVKWRLKNHEFVHGQIEHYRLGLIVPMAEITKITDIFTQGYFHREAARSIGMPRELKAHDMVTVCSLVQQGPRRPTLGLSSMGSAVRRVQEMLNKLGYKDVAVDGLFDDTMEAAVREFQEKVMSNSPMLKYRPGEVNNATWVMIESKLNAQSRTVWTRGYLVVDETLARDCKEFEPGVKLYGHATMPELGLLRLERSVPSIQRPDGKGGFYNVV